MAVATVESLSSALCATAAQCAPTRRQAPSPRPVVPKKVPRAVPALAGRNSFIVGQAVRTPHGRRSCPQASRLVGVRAEEDNGAVRFVESMADWESYMAEASDRLVVLDIATKTCGPCKLIYPKVVAMSKEYPDVMFLKINGDHSSETRTMMRDWGIKSVPCFRFYRNGELVHSHTGAKEDVLRSALLTHVSGTPVAAEP